MSGCDTCFEDGCLGELQMLSCLLHVQQCQMVLLRVSMGVVSPSAHIGVHYIALHCHSGAVSELLLSHDPSQSRHRVYFIKHIGVKCFNVSIRLTKDMHGHLSHNVTASNTMWVWCGVT